MYLWLDESQAQQIARHALAEAPSEVCGLIAGKDGRAQQVIPVPNVASDPSHHFEMEARSLIRAMFDIKAQGLSLLGFYHSHPKSAPIPSQTDIRESHYPGACHLIVSLSGDEPAFAAWQLKPDEVTRLDLHIGTTAPSTDSGSLSTAQRTAIILSMVAAFIFMILVSLSLLPPAPPIP